MSAGGRERGCGGRDEIEFSDCCGVPIVPNIDRSGAVFFCPECFGRCEPKPLSEHLSPHVTGHDPARSNPKQQPVGVLWGGGRR
jgi:hypothetical protein